MCTSKLCLMKASGGEVNLFRPDAYKNDGQQQVQPFGAYDASLFGLVKFVSLAALATYTLYTQELKSEWSSIPRPRISIGRSRLLYLSKDIHNTPNYTRFPLLLSYLPRSPSGIPWASARHENRAFVDQLETVPTTSARIIQSPSNATTFEMP